MTVGTDTEYRWVCRQCNIDVVGWAHPCWPEAPHDECYWEMQAVPVPEAQCICPRFRDTGGFRIADLTCPIHGLNGTDPGDGYWPAGGDDTGAPAPPHRDPGVTSSDLVTFVNAVTRIVNEGERS